MNIFPEDRIFGIKDHSGFLETALEVFHYQSRDNNIYKQFIDGLGRSLEPVNSLESIPFLPVEFFRNQKIITGTSRVEKMFESSSTTGAIPGKHYISDLALYERSFTEAFRLFYGDPSEYLICALLPSYTERSGSSLVYMADRLIQKSLDPLSGFYRENSVELIRIIDEGRREKKKVLLLGVSFALLDLAEKHSIDLSGVYVMETGGMKGRRKELTRSELHNILKGKFNLQTIHSEYGMTELLSQAYSAGDGIFYSPPWMKIMIRDPQDPLTVYTGTGKTGGINVIDLANINSCSFIATGDLGRLHDDGGFEVLGRFDSSDVRGCNLLAE